MTNNSYQILRPLTISILFSRITCRHLIVICHACALGVKRQYDYCRMFNIYLYISLVQSFYAGLTKLLLSFSVWILGFSTHSFSPITRLSEFVWRGEFCDCESLTTYHVYGFQVQLYPQVQFHEPWPKKLSMWRMFINIKKIAFSLLTKIVFFMIENFGITAFGHHHHLCIRFKYIYTCT